MIFNFLIGGTDAHAKNVSLLIAGRGQVRLAPCYDLISILPYARELRKPSPPCEGCRTKKLGGVLFEIG